MSDDYTTPSEPTADDINRAEDQIDELGPIFREEPEWFDDIGPEDADPEEVMENLDEYGFDIMDDDEDLSLPGAAPELPNWAQNTARTDTDDLVDEVETESGELRPVEDDIIEAELFGDEVVEDEEME